MSSNRLPLSRGNPINGRGQPSTIRSKVSTGGHSTYEKPSKSRPSTSRGEPLNHGEPSRRTKASSETGGPSSGGDIIEGRRIVTQSKGPMGRLYATTDDGQDWSKPRGGEWQRMAKPSPPPSQAPSDPLQLYLAIQEQARGEPDHWSLVVAREGQRGDVYQVKGDAERMTYRPGENANVLNSGSLRTAFVLNPRLTEEQHRRIEDVARSEPPPSAPSYREVRENCQGWCVRVLEQLCRHGIVTSANVAHARGIMQPVRQMQPMEIQDAPSGNGGRHSRERRAGRPAPERRPRRKSGCCIVM